MKITQFYSKQKWCMKRIPNARLNMLIGSVRSGKTVTANHSFISLFGDAPLTGDVFIIGKTLGSLERNVINPLQIALGNDFTYSKHLAQATLWDRTIYCFGAKDEKAKDVIQGSTCILAYGDEVTLWPESFFRMLDSRLSPDDARFIGTTNTDSPYHWLKKEYIDRKQEGVDINIFNFYLLDNSKKNGGFLSDKFIDSICKNFTGLWYKRLIENQWCVAEGAIYDFFDEDTHVLVYPPQKAHWYDIAIDYATSNPTVFLLTGSISDMDRRPHTWAEDEYYYDSTKEEKQKTDSEYAHDLVYFLAPVTSSVDPIIEHRFGLTELLRVKSERKRDIPLVNIFIDPSAASFALELQRWGFTGIVDADNEVVEGIKTTARMLKSREIAICEKCENLIEEMKGYTWDKKAQLSGLDKPVKKKDHAPDAFRYKIHTTFGKLPF